jgi:hypothetical protein
MTCALRHGCPVCGKTDGPFYESANLRDRGVCRPCHRAEVKAHDQAHPDAARARMRRYDRKRYVPSTRSLQTVKEKHERKMFCNARKRARARGLAFTITRTDVVIPTHCPVLGIARIRARQRLRDLDEGEHPQA